MHQTYPTTLIICSTRADFLSSLVKDVSSVEPLANQTSAVSELPHGEQNPGELQEQIEPPSLASHEESLTKHPLLIPTIHQVAISRHLATVFTHTISHIRAYLSVFPSPSPNSVQPPPAQHFDKPGTKTPLLVVYGLVALHRDTSEWSVQGLGTSIAALVEAGRRAGARIMLVEESELDTVSSRNGDGYDRWATELDNEVESEVDELRRPRQERNTNTALWKERLPMLNGSTRRSGFDSADGGWSGRTVEVQSILARWFLPGNADWEIIK